MQRGLSQRDRTWGIRTIDVRNQSAPVKRVRASFALGNENSEGAQQPSRIVGILARCFPAMGREHCRLFVTEGYRWRAVIEAACSSELRSRWSISLAFKNLLNWGGHSIPNLRIDAGASVYPTIHFSICIIRAKPPGIMGLVVSERASVEDPQTPTNDKLGLPASLF